MDEGDKVTIGIPDLLNGARKWHPEEKYLPSVEVGQPIDKIHQNIGRKDKNGIVKILEDYHSMIFSVETLWNENYTVSVFNAFADNLFSKALAEVVSEKDITPEERVCINYFLYGSIKSGNQDDDIIRLACKVNDDMIKILSGSISKETAIGLALCRYSTFDVAEYTMRVHDYIISNNDDIPAQSIEYIISKLFSDIQFTRFFHIIMSDNVDRSKMTDAEKARYDRFTNVVLRITDIAFSMNDIIRIISTHLSMTRRDGSRIYTVSLEPFPRVSQAIDYSNVFKITPWA